MTHITKLAPQKDLSYTFVWDRLDAYGRLVQGRSTAVGMCVAMFLSKRWSTGILLYISCRSLLISRQLIVPLICQITYCCFTVKVGYEYELVYYAVPSDFTNSFNRFSNAGVSSRVERSSRTAVFYIDKEAEIVGNELTDVGLAGWTLSVHHSYDAVSGL